LEIDEEYNGYFDFIFISEGSLQWIPNLNDYFRVVSRLLKKSGHVFISEMHPFVYLFENDDFDNKEMNFNKLTSYFKKGPYGYEDGIDYVGGVEYEAKECFWFMHKISDIINALLKNEIIIQEFNEYDIGNAGSDAENLFNGLPLSYILIGEKS
jgi:SAM-dependent methyltransferase